MMKPIEIEAKWALLHKDHMNVLRDRLRDIGGNNVEIHYENNIILDNLSQEINRNGKILRIRYINKDSCAILTFKGDTKIEEGVKKRRELEVVITNGNVMENIFSELGYRKVLEYEKTRETWRWGDARVMLDTLPCGEFCEIEGLPNIIKEIATKLNLDINMCENSDYATIMKKYLCISCSSQDIIYSYQDII